MREGEIDMAILPDVEDEIQVKLEEFESSFLLKDEMWLVGSGRDVNLPKTVVFKEFNTKPIVYYSHMYPKFLRLLIEQKVLPKRTALCSGFLRPITWELSSGSLNLVWVGAFCRHIVFESR